MSASPPPLPDPASVDEALRYLLWARELPTGAWEQFSDEATEAIGDNLDRCLPLVTTWATGIRKSSHRYHGKGRTPHAN